MHRQALSVFTTHGQGGGPDIEVSLSPAAAVGRHTQPDNNDDDPLPLPPPATATASAAPRPRHGLPFSQLHADRPARLTMYPPNRLAHGLFLDTRRRVNAEGLTAGQRACKCCWMSVTGGIAAFGAVGCVVGLANGDVAIVPVIFVFFVVSPLLVFFLWMYEKWQHLAPEKIHEVVAEILDGRVREALLAGGGLLAALEPPAGDERGRLVVDLFPGGLGPFRALQKGGYASVPAFATYHASFRAVLGRIAAGGDRDAVTDVHRRWLELLSKIAVAANGFCEGLDANRMRAYRRLARQGMDFAGDTLSDLADIGGMFSDLNDIKKSLEGIRDDFKDAKEAYKACGLDADFEGRSEEGLHPIVQRRLGVMIPFVCIICGLPSLSFGLFGSPPAAWAMAGIGFFMVIVMVFVSLRLNNSYQLLECAVELEVAQRTLLKKLISELAMGSDVRELVVATNHLRDVLLENYYSALAIHLQAEALTFRPFPYPGNPPMLVPREDCDEETGNGGLDGMAEEEEIVLSAGAGEPVLVAEMNETSNLLLEPSLPILVTATIFKHTQDTRAGIGFVPRNGSIHVSSIAPGGLFYGSDIRVGDELVAIGSTVGIKHHAEAARLIREALGNITVTVVRGNRSSNIVFAVASKGSPEAKMGIVFTTAPGGSVEVKRLTPGSPFEQTDIRPGDVVLSVNGCQVDNATHAATLIRTAEGVIAVMARSPHSVMGASAPPLPGAEDTTEQASNAAGQNRNENSRSELGGSTQEPSEEGKTVEMIIKPDGTKHITTTTTTRDADGTLTTTIKTSIVKGNVAEVPDYFHDEETGIYGM